MAINLSKHDIQPTLEMSTLVKLRALLVKLIEEYKKGTESASQIESKLREEALADEEAVAKAEEIKESFLDIVLAAIEETPAVAASLFEALGEVRVAVKEERDYWFKKYAREQRLEVVEEHGDKSSEEFKLEIDELRKLTVNMFNTMKPMGFVQASKEFPVKKNKAGDEVPDLPRAPHGPRAGGGRNGSIKFLSWEIDGKEIVGAETVDVIHDYLNSKHIRFSAGDLIKRIEAVNGGVSVTSGEKLTADINGHKVVVWKPTDEVDDDELEDEEVAELDDEEGE